MVVVVGEIVVVGEVVVVVSNDVEGVDDDVVDGASPVVEVAADAVVLGSGSVEVDVTEVSASDSPPPHAASNITVTTALRITTGYVYVGLA